MGRKSSDDYDGTMFLASALSFVFFFPGFRNAKFRSLLTLVARNAVSRKKVNKRRNWTEEACVEARCASSRANQHPSHDNKRTRATATMERVAGLFLNSHERKKKGQHLGKERDRDRAPGVCRHDEQYILL